MQGMEKQKNMTTFISHLGSGISSSSSAYHGQRLRLLPSWRRRWDGHLGFSKVPLSGICSSSSAYDGQRLRLVPSRRRSAGGMGIWVSAEYSCLQVQGVSYRAPGTQHNLLNQVTFSLPEKSLGLVYGRSGSGKTTLLQVLGGLAKPTEGSIYIQKTGLDGQLNQSPETLSASKVGIVFQFPERFFLADTVLEELTFGWPRQLQDQLLRQRLVMRLESAIRAVGLSGISLDLNPRSLSDGFKRRLALAVQLVRMPDILLLDEPLAGLDWKARTDVVKLLETLKKERMLIVVSHDLKEISPLVDKAWRMDMGGFLIEEPLFT